MASTLSTLRSPLSIPKMHLKQTQIYKHFFFQYFGHFSLFDAGSSLIRICVGEEGGNDSFACLGDVPVLMVSWAVSLCTEAH